jgi:NTP pyrophosphatase (non-canonical NTP hydrolase)
MNLSELRSANVQRCEEVFHPLSDWTPTDWACAMAGEAGEACNAVKKLRRLEDGTNTEKDPQTEAEAISAIAGELADTIIYADLLAARLGVDLGDAIRKKFNEVSRRMNSSVALPVPQIFDPTT